MRKVFFLAFYLCLVSMPGLCQIVDTDNFGIVNLNGKIKFFIDSTNSLFAKDILNIKGKFKDLPSQEPSMRFTENKKNYWLVFEVRNTSNKPIASYLKCSHPFTDFYAVFALNNGTLLDSAFFEYDKKLKVNFPKSARTPVFEHKLLPKSTTTFAIRVQNIEGSLVHTYDFYDADSFLKDNTISQIIYTVFFGIGLTLFIIALAFYIISRSSIYLYYGFYVIFINLGFQGIVGNLNMFFEPKIDFLLGDSSFRFYVPLSLIFNVLFLNRLFEIESKNVWYRRFSLLIIFLTSITVLLAVLDWGSVYLKLKSFIAPESLFVTFTAFTLVYNYNRKPQAFRLYALSFVPIMVLLIWRILISIGLLPQPTYFAIYFIIGLVLEILILLVGLSFNFIKKIYAQKNLEKVIITNQIETQENERKRIAQDLHDDLGATLALLGRNAKSENFSNENQEIIGKAIQDLRNISRNLLPADFESFGLILSLEKYIVNLNAQQKVKFTFISFGDAVKLKNDTDLNIYRILTELANNIMKHSQACTATIQLIYHADHLFISVEDDGLGLIKKGENNLGIGLKNVISRIEYLEARILEFGTGVNCSFVFEIPYKPHFA